ncbi:MAG: cysteine hydrolase family protein [Bacteroidales bacterium]|jgi:nicotinamidase-related amidase|nr:cysteine hydrolase family protein [Bacteroidales bacterium]
MLRKIIFAFVALSISLSLAGQTEKSKSALLIIDIQDFYFPGGNMPLYQPEDAAENAAMIINKFRSDKEDLIFIKHNYEPGGAIHKSVKPLEGEKIFNKNDVNSFLDTGLNEYLKEHHIDRLVICGMQTHMCVEAAVRAAADLGYECILIHDACTSRDLKFNEHIISAVDVHLSTLSTLSSYAKIMSAEEYLKR